MSRSHCGTLGLLCIKFGDVLHLSEKFINVFPVLNYQFVPGAMVSFTRMGL